MIWSELGGDAKRSAKPGRFATQLQNCPRGEAVRGIYVAPPEHVLFVCDYSQIELCALAQSCLTRFGKSRMAEVINSGEDVHRWFGNIIKENDHRPAEKKEGVDFRALAKVPNFGFPGGLGPEKLTIFARQNYGVQITVDEAAQLKRLWLEAFPEMTQHLRPPEDRDYGDGQTWYVAQTINGRRAAKSTYNASCNYVFQGLVADGAKLAAWRLYVAGFKVVNFVHDEFIVELSGQNPQQLQENCRTIEHIMLEAMRVFIPQVLVKAEGALMVRWDKRAKGMKDDQGNLLVWTPELAAALKAKQADLNKSQGKTT
jgi:DNA polymerase-1